MGDRLPVTVSVMEGVAGCDIMLGSFKDLAFSRTSQQGTFGFWGSTAVRKQTARLSSVLLVCSEAPSETLCGQSAAQSKSTRSRKRELRMMESGHQMAG